MPYTTTVTGTLSDTDYVIWANTQIVAVFTPFPFNNSHSWLGGDVVSPITTVTASDGTFELDGLADNMTVSPLGSVWTFTIIPNASVPPITFQLTITGNSQDISSVTSVMGPIEINPGIIPAAFDPTQVTTNILAGAAYYNNSNDTLYIYNGSAYVAIGQSPAGIVTTQNDFYQTNSILTSTGNPDTCQESNLFWNGYELFDSSSSWFINSGGCFGGTEVILSGLPCYTLSDPSDSPGSIFYINDYDGTPTCGEIITSSSGGGSTNILVWSNGTNWTIFGQ